LDRVIKGGQFIIRHVPQPEVRGRHVAHHKVETFEMKERLLTLSLEKPGKNAEVILNKY
jgi:hypothetical protein